VKKIPLKPIAVANLPKGEDYEVIGMKVTHRPAPRPASYVVLKYVCTVVKLKNSKVVSHSAPFGVFDRSFADISLVAGIIVDNFASLQAASKAGGRMDSDTKAKADELCGSGSGFSRTDLLCTALLNLTEQGARN
jgi:hypothetical protein